MTKCGQSCPKGSLWKPPGRAYMWTKPPKPFFSFPCFIPYHYITSSPSEREWQRENRYFVHFLRPVNLGSTCILSKMSQTEQVWNAPWVTGHNDFWVVFTVKTDIHFKTWPLGPPSLFHAHIHSHTRSWSGNVVQLLGLAGSCQVLHHEEHDHTGEQHPTNHKVLVLESPLLDEPHHRVGQAQHVGNVKDPLLSPLGQKRERKTGGVNIVMRWGFTNNSLLVKPKAYTKQHQPLSCGQMTFDQDTRATQGGKKSLSHPCAGTTGFIINTTCMYYTHTSYINYM